MTSGAESLNCKISVRKYVLVSQSSRWNQSGERVVVQSPILNITDAISHVPVKRFSKKEDNSVCFIPRTDIEQDASNIYSKSYVKTNIFCINAHGVALFDSAPGDKFEYRRTDRFWIWIEPNTNKYRTTVPVINLRTYKGGSIYIDHVCWYPKLQGPDQELWTLGGEKRHLKLSGSKKFSSWSWAISQKLDGSIATAKSVEVFSTEVQSTDRFELSGVERRALFEKRLHSMLLKRSAIRDSPIYRLPASGMALPNSEMDRAENREKLMALSVPSPVPTQASSTSKLRTSIGWWDGILELARHRRAASMTLRGSSIHPQNLQGDYNSNNLRLLRRMEVTRKSKDSMPGTMTISPPRTSFFPQVPDGRLSNLELGGLKGPGASDTSNQAEIRATVDRIYCSKINEQGSPPAFSVTDPGIMDGSISITQLYQRVKSTKSFHDFEQVSIASLCDLDCSDCEYSRLVPDFHYHSPPSKCQAAAAIENRPHEHCITRHFALPGRAGGCILITFPSRSHTCCYWAEEDRLEWESALGAWYQDVKADELLQHKQDIIDMSKMVREIPRDVHADLRFVELLDEAGRQMFVEDMHWSDV